MTNSNAQIRARTLEALGDCYRLTIRFDDLLRRLWDDPDAEVRKHTIPHWCRLRYPPADLFDSVVEHWHAQTEADLFMPDCLDRLLANYGDRSVSIVRAALISGDERLRNAAVGIVWRWGDGSLAQSPSSLWGDKEWLAALAQCWQLADAEQRVHVLDCLELLAAADELLPFVKEASRQVVSSWHWDAIIKILDARQYRCPEIAEALLAQSGKYGITPRTARVLCNCGGPEFELLLIARMSYAELQDYINEGSEYGYEVI